MKKLLFNTALLTICTVSAATFVGQAQQTKSKAVAKTSVSNTSVTTPIKSDVDVQAYLATHLKVNNPEATPGTTSNITLQIKVNAEGKITKVDITAGQDMHLAEFAIGKIYEIKWTPAKNSQNKAVESSIEIPVTYTYPTL